LLGPLTLALARIAIRMGNAPSVTGPDRGRSHVIRDDDSDNSLGGQRPVRSGIADRGAQLADKFNVEESNRNSSSLNVASRRIITVGLGLAGQWLTVSSQLHTLITNAYNATANGSIRNHYFS